MGNTPPCKTCHGRGPVSRWVVSDRGDMVPLPFQPCAGCGLDWPSETLSPLVILSPGQRRPPRPAPVSYANLVEHPDVLAVLAVTA